MVKVACLGSPSSSVCVECSLSDDCLRCYAFCKHSKSPIFNRSMRTLNRLPIYLGEDVCDRINREAVLSEIKMGMTNIMYNQRADDIYTYDKSRLKSVEYSTTYAFCDGRYSAERLHHTHHWITNRYYPTGYTWIQRDNDISAISQYGEHCSRNVENYYEDTRKAKKKFRQWFKSIAHNRIVARFNLNMNMLYGEKNAYQPIYEEPKYWLKQNLNDYHPIKNPKSYLQHQIKSRARYVYNGNKVSSCRKMEEIYLKEVDETRINQYERYKQLYKSTKDKNEGLWYLMKIGMLCYNDKSPYMYQKSRQYSFLGSLHSHLRYHNCPCWYYEARGGYDFPHLLWKCKDQDFCFNFDEYHKYHTYDAFEEFNEFLHTNGICKIPKINTIRWRMRKCMNELKCKKRRIRSDCGRRRGQNIRTTNPYYCIFTLYPICCD